MDTEVSETCSQSSIQRCVVGFLNVLYNLSLYQLSQKSLRGIEEAFEEEKQERFIKTSINLDFLEYSFLYQPVSNFSYADTICLLKNSCFGTLLDDL